MHIHGNIIKIESYGSKTMPIVLKVKNLKDEKNYNVKYIGFLPVHICDAINGVINEDNFFKNKPLVVPVENIDYLKQSLYACLRKSKFGYKKCENFLDELEKHCGDINNIFSCLNSLADDENKRDFLIDSINTTQVKKLLDWWKKNYLLRRLYLLGLNNKEIKFSYLNLNDIYEKIKKSPYIIHSITIEKANEINELLGKKTIKNEVIAGKITRFVCKNDWTSIPLNYIAKAFPEIYLCLDYIQENFPLVFDDKFVYSRYCYDMELYLSNLIASLLIRTENDTLLNKDLPKVINKIQMEEDIELTEEQNIALEGVLNNHISIITGGAGCGKTTLIKQIVKNLRYRNINFVLTSFTGKAVLRIKEILGKEFEDICFTLSLLIHKKKKKNKVPFFNVLIVDEASMISGSLFYDFLLLYKHSFKIILVGDVNQLPPIGYCAFFKQIIKSDKVPVYYLTENKRILNNAKSSNILLNANGLISKDRDYKKSFLFKTGKGFEIIEGEKEICFDIIKALKEKGIKMEEITILTPYNKDIDEINKYAQEIYLKENKVYIYGKRKFIIGDRMMQKTNIYAEEVSVMNGEEGIIKEISSDHLTIEFNKDKSIDYEWNDDENYKSKDENDENSVKEFLTQNLQNSFCKTIHKSQGSEYNYVIIYLPRNDNSNNFININLLYTGITRTKKTIWLVTNRNTLNLASRTELPYCYDRLSEKIIEIVGS